MPGHKGIYPEYAADITEVAGADSLFHADGIIAESERLASAIFGAHTFFGTEGSSLSLRGMLYLFRLWAVSEMKPVRILAGRNCHRTFLSAAAVLDIDVSYIEGDSYLSCLVSAEDAESGLSSGDFGALYVTSPDYLGGITDIARLAEICHRRGVLLLVDNAHGAYLKFLEPSLHPISLGADMCCDSAHKTLPVLTGGAYLHINTAAPSVLRDNAKRALSLFATTSPSYLILRSLDRVNPYLAEEFALSLHGFIPEVEKCKNRLRLCGYDIHGDEPMKITLCPKGYGYTGDALADVLRGKGIEVEFSDPDFLVMMVTPETGTSGLDRLTDALISVPKKAPITLVPPKIKPHTPKLSPRAALFSPSVTVDIKDAMGRILADPSVGCPPAVPILICGEVIEETDVETFLYYGIRRVSVVNESV